MMGGQEPAAQGYNHRAIERKWQQRWLEAGIYTPDLRRARNPFYNLMMFPYPSAEGLHVGNVYAFTGADIYGRHQRMRGHDVFEPIGLDGFGIHSENYAIKVGEHPAKLAASTQRRFYEQLQSIGNGFAWDHRLETYDPAYYRWTQWLFIQLFKQGLAYRASARVNWCPGCQTVLADEQVVAGECERCGSQVEIRDLEQWFFRITAYADRLLDNLDTLDWSERVKNAQRQWIGRKRGAEIRFRVAPVDGLAAVGADTWVFTTRPDTVFGCTFLALAPDHPMVSSVTTPEHRVAVETYLAGAAKRRGSNLPADPGLTPGVATGASAINPANGQHVPIWIAEYVVSEYGTGAIMGVPAHDPRDWEFARAVGLSVVPVVVPPSEDATLPFTGEGRLVRSGRFTGLSSAEAKAQIIAHLESQGDARAKTAYHLRDWLISRQRYWGPPIPMVSCPRHGWVPVAEADLPVRLPETDQYIPTAGGGTPLARVESFVHTTCPVCGGPARRSDEVSDTFLDSAWYFLRYPSVTIRDRPWDPELTRRWLPVDVYIAGAEHAVLHLLYARFLTMALHDMGLLEFEEPFVRLRAHGLLIKEGAKMSKSRGNVIVPDTYIAAFGADVLRTYLMFIGPFDQGGSFQDKGLKGIVRFLRRVWSLTRRTAARRSGAVTAPGVGLGRPLHETVRKVSRDIDGLKFNTAIAAMMEFVNVWESQEGQATREIPHVFLRLLAPFAPHLTEELWVDALGETFSIHQAPWPAYDEQLLQQTVTTIPVLVNGKVRDQMEVPIGATEGEVVAFALARSAVRRHVPDAPKRTVYVPGRVLNIVA
jgi:leucyl-tRNA synthetase